MQHTPTRTRRPRHVAQSSRWRQAMRGRRAYLPGVIKPLLGELGLPW